MRTSHGQTLLREILSQMINGQFIENHRPDWLFGMELDFFFPDWDLAFEFQGDQHFAPVFGAQAHLDQKERDRRKRSLCLERRVILVSVEARELTPEQLRKKLWIHLTMKLSLTRGQQKEWMGFVLRADNKHFNSQMRRTAADYRNHLKRSFGDLPTLHKKGSTARREAANALWNSPSP